MQHTINGYRSCCLCKAYCFGYRAHSGPCWAVERASRWPRCYDRRAKPSLPKRPANRVVAYVARCVIDLLVHNNDNRRSKHSLSSCSAVKSKQFSGQGCSLSNSAGSYLTWIYFLMKLVFIGNAVGHIYIVTVFTQTNYTFYGYELLRDVIRGEEWHQSGT